MAASTIRSSVSVKAHDHGPNLSNTSRYKKFEKIPIIDTLKRSYFTKNKDGKTVKVNESVDEEQLERLLENSRLRSEEREYGLVFIGHTDDEGSEVSQPPKVGYLSNYELGEYNGKPAILADMYIDKKYYNPDEVTDQFPRRSAEVISISKPDGYIDSIALMKRTTERPLGLVTSLRRLDGDVTRFECPACKKEQQKARKMESKQFEGKAHSTVVKNALKLVETMMQEMIRKHTEPSEDSSDASESSDTSDTMSLSDSSEPSMSRYASKSRYRREPSDSSGMEPSDAEPSIDSDASEPSKVKKAARRKPSMDEPSNAKRRMDPSDVEPSDSSDSSDASESSRTTMRKKSKMQAGNPGPTTTPPTWDSSDSSSAKPITKSKSRMSREDTRMRRESDQIQVSRFKKELDKANRMIESLMARLDASDSDKRRATIERKVAQLEYEGYELDRPRTVARFMKMSDEEHEDEIDYIRHHNRQTIVNQPMIPNISGDVGGATLQRPLSIHALTEPLPEEYENGIPTVGSEVYRFAKANDIKVRKGGGVTAAVEAISRFREAKNKSRMG